MWVSRPAWELSSRATTQNGSVGEDALSISVRAADIVILVFRNAVPIQLFGHQDVEIGPVMYLVK